MEVKRIVFLKLRNREEREASLDISNSGKPHLCEASNLNARLSGVKEEDFTDRVREHAVLPIHDHEECLKEHRKLWMSCGID
ncbi:hypothetical protein Pint_18036 [Pistacia integerrima]|uniref:Uncharacterized protein n=1 Tax=Pistacia integerrima TaxID=434235 RepID=A0ACC0YXF7_9ROSI|nr:hypothetical protein Pint_18036 [Pistacia integerrima]